MIGLNKYLNKQQRQTNSLLQQGLRSFAGGGAKPKPIDPKETNFDIIFVGKSQTLKLV